MRRTGQLGCIALMCAAGFSLHAQAQSMEARELLEATNQDRAAHGLGPLRWNPALAHAAQAHAERMVRAGGLSHQFPGEPDLTTRASRSGAHFSTVAENIAVAADPQTIESEWMHSPPHRHNILDPRLNEVGIGLVRQGDRLWAVEDFSTAVVAMGSSQIEQHVAQLLRERGLPQVSSSPAARQSCAMEHGFAGQRPNFVMRWEGSNLSRLPDVLEQKINTGRFRSAAVGACNAGNQGGFTTYRVAVLLY
jgi:Cysteine-rich secretory protein family